MHYIKQLLSGFYFLLLAQLVFAQPSNIAIDNEQSMVPLAALYESRQIKLAIRPQTAKQQWQFRRSENRVEKHLLTEKKVELWEKYKHEISFSHIFLEHKRIVEYNAGDLRSLGQHPDWSMVQHIIDPQILKRLQKIGETKILGYQATQYKGQLNGTDFEVSWIDELQIPALIRQINRDVTYSVHLLEVYPQATSPWKKLDTEGFLAIDYADLGDNESDPLWAALGDHH